MTATWLMPASSMCFSFASTVTEIMVPSARTPTGRERSVQSTQAGPPAVGLAAPLHPEVLDRDLLRGQNEEGAGARGALYRGPGAAQALRAPGSTGPPQ